MFADFDVEVPLLGDGPDSEAYTRRCDEAQAAAILSRLAMRASERGLRGDLRPSKGIVFSQNHWDLQGVTHSLLLRAGPSACAEHWGPYRSSELSRFRHGVRPFRACPRCAGETDLVETQRRGSGRWACRRTLLEVVHCRPGVDDPNDQRTWARHLVEEERVVGHEPGQDWTEDQPMLADLRDPHPTLARRAPYCRWRRWGADACRRRASLERFDGPGE